MLRTFFIAGRFENKFVLIIQNFRRHQSVYQSFGTRDALIETGMNLK